MNTNIFCVYYENKPYEIQTSWLTPISAGTLSTEWGNLGKLTDDVGENINDLNKYFCELSAHYSIWKNKFYNNELVGFFHYRRYLNLIKLQNNTHGRLKLEPTNEVLELLINEQQIVQAKKILGHFDIIVPEKFLLGQSISQHFLMEHDAEIWQDFILAINEILPQYAANLSYFDIQYGLSVNNMFITRTEIADKYFKYLFAVLNHIICRRGLEIPGGHPRFPNYRYPAFLAERFLDFFIFCEKISPYYTQQIVLEADA